MTPSPRKTALFYADGRGATFPPVLFHVILTG